MLWGQEEHVHCRVTGCWVCSSGPLSPASSSSQALVKIDLLESWQLAVWWYSWGCDTPGTLSEPPSTELMLLYTLTSSLLVSTISPDISLDCSNCGPLLGWLIMPSLTLTVKCWMGRITSSLCNTEEWNVILLSSKWSLSKKRMDDKVLLIAPCHHIIAVTLALRRYTLQTKQLVTHKPEEETRKNKLCIVATIFLLVVGTNSLI